MRKRDRRELGRYVRHVADLMELRDWTVCIGHEPCEDRCDAVVHCVNGQRKLTISFSRGFRDLPAEEQRETVVHELVHAHADVCWKMVQTDLAEALGKPVYYVFCDSYRRAMEFQVDALARALARHMPLIDWPA